MKKDIKYYRSAIDRIDQNIIRLLHGRAENVRHIARLKNEADSGIYDPAREAAVLRRLKAMKGAFPASGVEAVYNEIFSVSRRMQRKITVAYLGPVASYTHLAAKKRFGIHTEYAPVNSVKDVFWKVEKGSADYGCVPIENSTEGAVNYTYDMFADFDLKIYSEVVLPIQHCLLSKNADKSRIKVIYSHAMSFAQCRGWLEKYLPKAVLKEVSSNSKAAEIAARTKNSAAIASELAGSVFGLNVLSSSIQDMTDNFTRFFILSHDSAKKTKKDKTTIMVSIKDKPGALYHILKPFESFNVNLTNIESRPSKKKAWDYYFFIDMQGHMNDPRVKKALAAVERNAGSVKILGSYPQF